jgi:hypothetical protein
MFGAIIGAVAAVQAQMEHDLFLDQYMQQPAPLVKAVSWDTDEHIDVPALIPPPQTTGNAMLDALMANLHEDGSGTA